jgi:dCMP deaminase
MITKREDLSKWDLRMLELAEHVAGWSKDPSTRVGAVIAQPDRRVSSLGYNGFPRGVWDDDARYADRDTKMRFVCHAERNALDNAEISLRGCTMYVTLQPCADCTKSMIQRGISRVVTKVNLEREQYYRDFVDHSVSMMEEAGVEVMQVGD